MNRKTTHDRHDTYVSTTIPYVNAPPHVGFALELVQTDALVRGLRAFGERVHSSTGTDDHSLKNVRAAEARGEPVEQLLARNSQAFADVARALGAHFDDCVRTSSDLRHRAAVQRLLRACAASGDLYRKRYKGTYCVGCESFLTLDELVDGLCPEHARPPEVVEEENWFFQLSRYGDALLRAISEGRLRILPEERKNEVVAFVRSGLKDFSVSRSSARARGLGISIPDDPEQIVYVWVDALANYLSTFDYGDPTRACGWQTAGRRVHVLGKGVLRFHAVYWPALLLSAGLPIPDELRVHGYLTVEGKKIGKSLGNGLDPLELVRSYGASALRYYLLRHVPPFKDADFSRERLIAAHDGEVADELGNLVRRVSSLVHRHASGRVPEPGVLGERERALEVLTAELPRKLASALRDHDLSGALNATWELVRAGNRYFDLCEPWREARLAGNDPNAAARLRTCLACSVGVLRALGTALHPFVPDLAERVTASLGLENRPNDIRQLSVLRDLPVGWELREPPVIAPRLRDAGVTPEYRVKFT